MTATRRRAALAVLIAGLVLLAGCRAIVPPAFTPASRVFLHSAHGRYVIAEGAEDGWALRQSAGLDGRGWFTLYDLGYDNLGRRVVGLKAWTGRFVTAPMSGSTRQDRMLWQEAQPGDCARFSLESLAGGKIALRTCAGRYLTAGNDGPGWEPPLTWAIVGETTELKDWEQFTLGPRP